MIFRRFTGFHGKDLDGWLKYVNAFYNKMVDDLSSGLNSLGLENFEGKILSGEKFDAGETRRFPHPFNRIPRAWIVTRRPENVDIVETSVTDRYVELKNTGSGSGNISFIILR